MRPQAFQVQSNCFHPSANTTLRCVLAYNGTSGACVTVKTRAQVKTCSFSSLTEAPGLRLFLLRSMSKPLYLVCEDDGKVGVWPKRQFAVNQKAWLTTNHCPQWQNGAGSLFCVQICSGLPTHHGPPIPNKRAAAPPASQFSCSPDWVAERRRAAQREGTSLSSLSRRGGWRWWTVQEKGGLALTSCLSWTQMWETNDSVILAALLTFTPVLARKTKNKKSAAYKQPSHCYRSPPPGRECSSILLYPPLSSLDKQAQHCET